MSVSRSAGGRREFIEYLGDGLEDGQWAAATKKHYGYGSLGELQQSWVAWVGRGFPAIERAVEPPSGGSEPRVLLAGATKPHRPEPNLIWRIGRKDNPAAPAEAIATKGTPTKSVAEQDVPASQALPGRRSSGPSTSGWRAVNDGSRGGVQVAQGTPLPKSQPIRTELSHPQPVEKSRQIILEWHQ